MVVTNTSLRLTPAAEEVVTLLLKYPELLQRPIVVKGSKAVIARPPERMLPLLGLVGLASELGQNGSPLSRRPNTFSRGIDVRAITASIQSS